MKKSLLIIAFLFAAYIQSAFAQTYSVSGPRTVFELPANKGTNKYTFFNFETGKEVLLSDSNSVKWDVAFSKTTILFNGGTSGPGQVTAQVISGTSFAAKTEAPVSGYIADAADKAVPTGSGNGWYMSNSGVDFSGPHTITPIQDRIIAVKLANGKYVKLQMLNYYKGVPVNVPTEGAPYTGVPQFISFRYLVSEGTGTDWSQQLTKVSNLKAESMVPQYFNLATATQVTSTEKDAGASWNLLFKNTSGLPVYDGFNLGIYGNSGTNGSGTDSLQLVSSPFLSYTTAPSSNWTSSNAPSPVWYVYNGGTHVISPLADKVVLVKTSLNRYAKVRIDNFYKNADNSNINDYGYYTLTYYFQPDGTTDLTTSPEIVTGLLPSASVKTVKLFPNPVSVQTTSVQTDLILSGATVQIMDMRGTEVYRSSFDGTRIELSNASLSKGMYIVVIANEGNVFQQKLVVE